MIAQLFGSIQEFIALAFIIGTVCLMVGLKGAGKWLVSLVGLSVLASLLFGFVREHPIFFGVAAILALLGGLALLFRRRNRTEV
ncbi:MAG: LPXTG cell wall anchor domain-containing protein [Desulfovibrionaceae bacterium]